MDMKHAIAALVVLLLTVSFAGIAPATTTGYWAVDWSGLSTIHFTLTGTALTTARIGPAVGRFSTVPNGGAPTFSSRVFCVDLLHYASDDFTNEYAVDKHTQADGDAGWRTPQGDGDELRSTDGLVRAAALANTYGWNWLDTGSATDQFDRRIALNVAIWKAAYGSRFSYTGGLNAQQSGYYNQLISYYDTGATASTYTWYDSKVNDAPSTNQDFLQAEVPEPSSVILLATVLIGAGLLTVKRRRIAG